MDEARYHPDPLLRLLNTTWPAFRAFRIDVRVSWTIAIWPILFTVEFSRFLSPAAALAWGVVWTLALFATTFTHEMGHIGMGRRCGIESERMTLRGLGGLAHLDSGATNPRDEIRIALAGPATHLAWMAVLFPMRWLLGPAYEREAWYWMLDGFARLQVSMMVFNLLPIYPMDGGRTLRGLLWRRMHVTRASFHVATVGFAGNGAFLLFGLLSALGDVDPFGFGPYGFLLAWIGFEGIQACRRLRLQARYGEADGGADPFQQVLMASKAAGRGEERAEARERAARAAARERRRALKETVDRLLDRVNEVGGVDRLPRRERKALERASRDLTRLEGGG